MSDSEIIHGRSHNEDTIAEKIDKTKEQKEEDKKKDQERKDFKEKLTDVTFSLFRELPGEDEYKRRRSEFIKSISHPDEREELILKTWARRVLVDYNSFQRYKEQILKVQIYRLEKEAEFVVNVDRREYKETAPYKERLLRKLEAGARIAENFSWQIIRNMGLGKDIEIKHPEKVEPKPIHWDLFDSIAYIASEEIWIEEFMETEELPPAMEYTKEEIIAISKDLDRNPIPKKNWLGNKEGYPGHPFLVVMTSYDFKRYIRKPNMSNSELKRRVKELAYFVLDGKMKVLATRGKPKEDGEDGKLSYQSVTAVGAICSMIILDEEEENFPKFPDSLRRKLRGKGSGKDEDIFLITFNSPWSLVFWSNLMNRAIRFFPASVYDMSFNARTLYRAILGGKNPTPFMNRKQIGKVLGWRVRIKNIYDQIGAIDRIAKELQDNWLTRVETKYEGESKVWRFWKRDNPWRQPRKLKKGSEENSNSYE